MTRLRTLAASLSFAALAIGPRARLLHAHTPDDAPKGTSSRGTSSGTGAAQPSAEQIGARVQAFYDQTKTFQADFKQQYYIKVHASEPPRTSEGHVAFEKPGKMSWRYEQPNGNRVVSDGRVLKVYEQENQQMFEQPVQQSQQAAALAFLMGEGRIVDSFSLRLLDPAAVKFEGGWVLEGTPKSPTPAYQKVLLYVDAGTSQVRRVLILDAQGNRNRFDFDNPQVNRPISPSEFTFAPPAGTQIVKP